MKLLRTFPLIATVAAAALLSGCSNSSDSQGDSSDISVPEANFSAQTLPLDDALYSPGDGVKRNYANALIMQPCLQKKGFSEPIPALDVTALNYSVRGIFDTDWASAAGYHAAPQGATPKDQAAWTAYTQRQTSTAEDAAFIACKSELKDSLFEPPTRQINYVANLVSASYEASVRDQTVRQASKKWQTCMADAGIPDLPDTPSKMPSDSVAKKFGLDEPGANVTTSISAAERELAVKDAGCRSTSGFDRAQYKAEYDAQVERYKQNVQQVAAMRAAIDKLDKSVTASISKNIPEAQ